MTRRSLLNKIWLGLGLAALAEFGWIAMGFLRPRSRRPGPATESELFEAGPADSFAPNSVTAFRAGRFYLVRLEDGGFLALSRKCTHLGCTVPWEPQTKRFVCPCHASSFEITGAVLGPPAPRALDLHPIVIENRVLKVDTATTIERTGFDKTQASYARDV